MKWDEGSRLFTERTLAAFVDMLQHKTLWRGVTDCVWNDAGREWERRKRLQGRAAGEKAKVLGGEGWEGEVSVGSESMDEGELAGPEPVALRTVSRWKAEEREEQGKKDVPWPLLPLLQKLDVPSQRPFVPNRQGGSYQSEADIDGSYRQGWQG